VAISDEDDVSVEGVPETACLSAVRGYFPFMSKATRKGITSTPFPFPRQFTAPPFFVGIEDARLKSKLLLDAVQRTRKTADVPPSEKHAVPPGKRTKNRKKK
jgi:hypothetical protein